MLHCCHQNNRHFTLLPIVMGAWAWISWLFFVTNVGPTPARIIIRNSWESWMNSSIYIYTPIFKFITLVGKNSRPSTVSPTPRKVPSCFFGGAKRRNGRWSLMSRSPSLNTVGLIIASTPPQKKQQQHTFFWETWRKGWQTSIYQISPNGWVAVGTCMFILHHITSLPCQQLDVTDSAMWLLLGDSELVRWTSGYDHRKCVTFLKGWKGKKLKYQKMSLPLNMSTRWAPTSYKWSYKQSCFTHFARYKCR